MSFSASTSVFYFSLMPKMWFMVMCYANHCLWLMLVCDYYLAEQIIQEMNL